MSDTPVPPQAPVPPGAYPPPPPPPPPPGMPPSAPSAQGYGAPPVPSPAQSYGAPGSAPVPTPVPKKKRVWLWVLIIALVLGCCITSVVVAVVGGFVASGVDEAATVTKADASYNKAVEALTKVGDDFDAIGGADADAAKVATFATGSKVTLDGARADLAAARATIETLPDSEARTTYVKGLAEADKGLEAIQAMIGEVTGKSALLTEVDAASESYRQGNDKMNAAVIALNLDKWKAAGESAAPAKALFMTAREGYLKAQGMDATAGMDKAVAYVDVQIQRATTVTQMANQGSRGNLRDYNRLVKEFNTLNRKIDSMPEPEAISDPNWATARLDTLREDAVSTLTTSDELMNAAHALFAK